MSANVFLSYTLADHDLAAALAESLAKIGIHTTSDMDLKAGDKWPDEFRDALTRSDAMVSLLSPAATDSAVVMQELGAAMATEKPVVVVNPHPGPLAIARLRGLQVVQAAEMSTDQIAATVRDRLDA